MPSEIILTFAGFSASLGDLDLAAAWIAATIGSLVGAWVLYAVGAVIGYDRVHELSEKRWFVLFGASDLERGERFFAQHGNKVVFLGRFIPLVRSIVSVPAGIDRMPLVRFSLLTAIGSAIWNAVFIGLGYQLGERWDVVEQWMEPLTYAVVLLLGVGIVWLIVRKVRGTGA